MSEVDIIDRLRACETRPLVTMDERPDPEALVELWRTLNDARIEIERLRLTDEERLAIRRAAAVADEMHDSRLKAALGGLLERTK
jgi:hypothetical protein